MKYDLLATECVSKIKNQYNFQQKNFFNINRLINRLRFFGRIQALDILFTNEVL
jgi:hypothetical protein